MSLIVTMGDLGSVTESDNTTSEHYMREQDICGAESTERRRVTVAELVACIIAAFTVLENVVILVAIKKGPRSLGKPTYSFIASLAVADLLTGFEVLLAVFIPVGSNPLSRVALKGLAVVTFIASVNSLLMVSGDRYLRIVRHAEYDKLINRKKVFAIILLSWLLTTGVFLAAPLLGWSCGSRHCCAHDGLCICMRSKYGDDVCGEQCSQSFVPFTKLYIGIGVVYFGFSVIVMTVLYGIIFKVVKEKTFGGDSKSHRKTCEIRLAKTLVITLAIFVFCWAPVVGLFIADLSITQHNDVLTKAFDFALVPSIINSFMNPIIYSIRLQHIRRTILKVFLPCIYDGKNRGSSWVSSTSGERQSRPSFRRLSRRRKNTTAVEPTPSTSSGAKSPTPPLDTEEKLMPNSVKTSPDDSQA